MHLLKFCLVGKKRSINVQPPRYVFGYIHFYHRKIPNYISLADAQIWGVLGTWIKVLTPRAQNGKYGDLAQSGPGSSAAWAPPTLALPKFLTIFCLFWDKYCLLRLDFRLNIVPKARPQEELVVAFAVSTAIGNRSQIWAKSRHLAIAADLYK